MQDYTSKITRLNGDNAKSQPIALFPCYILNLEYLNIITNVKPNYYYYFMENRIIIITIYNSGNLLVKDHNSKLYKLHIPSL